MEGPPDSNLRKYLEEISFDIEKSNEEGLENAAVSLRILEGELIRKQSGSLTKIQLCISIARTYLGTGRIDRARESVEMAIGLTAAREKATQE